MTAVLDLVFTVWAATGAAVAFGVAVTAVLEERRARVRAELQEAP